MRKRSNKLTEQKKNRIAAALTVNAVVLIVILAAFAIYQLAVIVRTANQVKQLEEEYDKYSNLFNEARTDLEKLEEMLLEMDSSDTELYILAVKNGYVLATEND